MEGLKDRLKAARKALKLSQKDMAESVGASYGSWQSYEAGKQVPGSQVIAGMVGHGINANWLLAAVGPMLLAELQDQRFDVETLEKAVETLELALQVARKKTTSAAEKAELIASMYGFLIEEGSDEDKRSAAVLKLIKMLT